MSDTNLRLGYSFHDGSLLLTALTHPSYGGDHHVDHYQRLEFLGDAVLELYVSKVLYKRYPHLTEGALTRARAELVREETLARAAARLGLNERIRLSVGEERSGGREKPSILCDVMEAVIGAVYVDGGADEAGKLIRLALGERFEDEVETDPLDAKSRLQAILQSRGEMPVYELVSCEGPAHQPVFTYRVYLNDALLGEGAGNTKQAAQLSAAKCALKTALSQNNSH